MEKKRTGYKRYPSELKERAVRMVLDPQRSDPGDKSVMPNPINDQPLIVHTNISPATAGSSLSVIGRVSNEGLSLTP